MKKLFDSADRYLAKSDWRDIALIKFCLFSMGLLFGTGVKAKDRKPVRLLAIPVFVVTYIVLMQKYLRILLIDMKK